MTFGCEFLIKCASLKVGLVLVQVRFLNPDFLIDVGTELTCFWAQMRAENMQLSKLVLLSPICAFKPEPPKSKLRFFWTPCSQSIRST